MDGGQARGRSELFLDSEPQIGLDQPGTIKLVQLTRWGYSPPTNSDRPPLFRLITWALVFIDLGMVLRYVDIGINLYYVGPRINLCRPGRDFMSTSE